MDSSESIAALRIIVAVVVLSYASLLDWRTRKIGNVYWIGLSAIGLILIPAQVLADDEPLSYALILVPIVAILSDIYWDADENGPWARFAPAMKYAVAIVAIILLAYAWSGKDYFLHLLTAPIMMLFVVGLYMVDVIKGGADAKALIALSVLFPFYPGIGPIPMIEAESVATQLIFPFSFVVLLTAAIFVAFFPIGFMVRNLLSHEFGSPQGFLGYKIDAASTKGRHVWLMERIEGGVHRRYTRPRSNEDLDKEVQLLVASGRKRIWVTPKIPFIIPILAAVIFSFVVGNVLLLFFNA